MNYVRIIIHNESGRKSAETVITNPDAPSRFSENHRNMRQDKRSRMYREPPPEYTQWSTAGAKRLVAHSVLELEASLNEFQIRIIHAQDDRDVWVTLPTGSRYLFLLAGSVPAKRL